MFEHEIRLRQSLGAWWKQAHCTLCTLVAESHHYDRTYYALDHQISNSKEKPGRNISQCKIVRLLLSCKVKTKRTDELCHKSFSFCQLNPCGFSHVLPGAVIANRMKLHKLHKPPGLPQPVLPFPQSHMKTWPKYRWSQNHPPSALLSPTSCLQVGLAICFWKKE